MKKQIGRFVLGTLLLVGCDDDSGGLTGATIDADTMDANTIVIVDAQQRHDTAAREDVPPLVTSDAHPPDAAVTDAGVAPDGSVADSGWVFGADVTEVPCDKFGHALKEVARATCAGATRPVSATICFPNPTGVTHLEVNGCVAKNVPCGRYEVLDARTGLCCQELRILESYSPYCVRGGDKTDFVVALSYHFVDVDMDLQADLVDNCPTAFNPFQADTNGDSIGDACQGQDASAM